MICGLDISTSRIGMNIYYKNGNLSYRTYTFRKEQSHKERRQIILSLVNDMKVKTIFCEEVRLFSFGGTVGKKRNFINVGTMLRLYSILTTLIDNGINVYTMNSRSWKSRILKPAGFEQSKEGSVLFVKHKYGIDVNHDVADAICQSLYAKKFKNMCKKID